MELIDAYVAEVGRHLPEKQHADIEREIRSMIEDTLDDESAKQSRPADEELLVEILQRLGAPEKLAASYSPPSYLIGPTLYPSYLLTLKLVLVIVLAAAALGLSISLVVGSVSGTHTPLEALRALALGFGGLFNVALQVVGMITIIFALIQRAAPGVKPIKLGQEFDPRKLKTAAAQPARKEPFKPVGLIFEIVMTIFALVTFNTYRQYVGVYIYDGSRWSIIPVLTDAFFAYLPYLNILWGLEVALKSSVLALGGWTLTTKWLRIGLKVLTIALLYVMITGPAIVAVPLEAIIHSGSAEFSQFSTWVDLNVMVALAIALIVLIIDVLVTTLKGLLFKKPLPVTE